MASGLVDLARGWAQVQAELERPAHDVTEATHRTIAVREAANRAYAALPEHARALARTLAPLAERPDEGGP